MIGALQDGNTALYYATIDDDRGAVLKMLLAQNDTDVNHQNMVAMGVRACPQGENV